MELEKEYELTKNKFIELEEQTKQILLNLRKNNHDLPIEYINIEYDWYKISSNYKFFIMTEKNNSEKTEFYSKGINFIKYIYNEMQQVFNKVKKIEIELTTSLSKSDCKNNLSIIDLKKELKDFDNCIINEKDDEIKEIRYNICGIEFVIFPNVNEYFTKYIFKDQKMELDELLIRCKENELKEILLNLEKDKMLKYEELVSNEMIKDEKQLKKIIKNKKEETTKNMIHNPIFYYRDNVHLYNGNLFGTEKFLHENLNKTRNHQNILDLLKYDESEELSKLINFTEQLERLNIKQKNTHSNNFYAYVDEFLAPEHYDYNGYKIKNYLHNDILTRYNNLQLKDIGIEKINEIVIEATLHHYPDRLPFYTSLQAAYNIIDFKLRNNLHTEINNNTQYKDAKNLKKVVYFMRNHCRKNDGTEYDKDEIMNFLIQKNKIRNASFAYRPIEDFEEINNVYFDDTMLISKKVGRR